MKHQILGVWKMTNAVHNFQNEMQMAGLEAGHIIADGKIHRCGTSEKPRSKNGWYVFFEDPPESGAFGNWKTGGTGKWTSGNGDGLSAADRAIFKKRLEAAQKARQKEDARRQELAQDRARKILDRCTPAQADHPYLVKKQVKPYGDLRQMKSLVVLPVIDETGAVTSLQFISPDGTKRFLTGGKITGGFFPIKGADGPLHICEGYATGATIHEATGATVLCAFNAGNLEAVAQMARRKYPDREIIIVADNDRGTEGNPGLTKGKQAAEAIGAKIVFPIFPEQSTGTDFNDLMAEQGIDVVKGAMKAKENDPWKSISSERILDCLAKNEDGDGYLLRQVAKDLFCFDHRTEQWFKFCNHYWAVDEKAEIFDQVEVLTNLYVEEAQRQFWEAMEARKRGDKDKVQYHEALAAELGKRITRLQAKHRKENIIILSRNGANSLGIAGTEWNSDPYALPCNNGVINLRTGKIRQGVPGDFFKIISPTEYLGEQHSSPAWEKFVLQLFDGDQEMADFTQTLLGGSLIGHTIEHFLAIFVGKGRNGKDTMLESIRAVLGDGIASPIQSETLMSQSNAKDGSSHKADVVALKGKRIVWASETSEERKLNAEKIKLLTGGGSLSGREPYARRPITFTPTHNVFLLTNFKPKANPDDYALWQRIHVIVFPLSFVDEPAGEQERKRDPHVLEKLSAESSGILSWLIRGCLQYQTQGKLIPPVKVRTAVEAYRQENDNLNLWIGENCTSNGQERAGVLFENYRTWCQKNGNECLNRTQFGKRMKERFDSYPGKWITYIGISLNKDDHCEIKDSDRTPF